MRANELGPMLPALAQAVSSSAEISYRGPRNFSGLDSHKLSETRLAVLAAYDITRGTLLRHDMIA